MAHPIWPLFDLDGAAIGTTSLDANEFATLRQFESGSWYDIVIDGLAPCLALLGL